MWKKALGFMCFPLLVLPVLLESAQDPPGVVHIALGSKYPPPTGSLDAEHKIVRSHGRLGQNPAMVVRREGNSPAELHETHTHVLIVQSGEGTLVLGGEIVDARTTTPGEVRGTSIRNGVEKRLV